MNSTERVTISIDAMGGDHGLKSTILGTKIAMERHPELDVIFVGKKEQMAYYLKKHHLNDNPRVTLVHAEEIVEMDESPALALRNKKKSSMRVAINLVKEGKAGACVSSGNTGALMATSRFVLKTLPGIDRPAIVYSLPTACTETNKIGKVHMLDLGANVDCSADHLLQFAVMGSVLSAEVDNIKKPTIALLNIGEEAMKGLDVIKEAAVKIESCPELNYVGYVEGTKILQGTVNVIVCDGFIGNIALKTIEGVVKYIACHVKMAFNHSWFTKMCGLFAWPIFRAIRKTLDLSKHNGASLLGLKGIVIKSHGGAKPEAFATAVSEAVYEVEKDIPNKIHALLDEILGEEDAG